jgi:hypothetical protein
MSSDENVNAILILDIVGRPPEYLMENLERIAEEMGKEKGVKIISKNIKEPTPLKENKEFYTTFAEIEVETENILYLVILMFKYMPAHVEVLSPERITLANNEWSDILSELTRKLHSYDEVARVIQAERVTLLQKLKELEGKTKTTEDKTEKKQKKEKKK